MILAIDTAMLYAAVAVVDDDGVRFAGTGRERRSHSEELGPLLQQAIGGRADQLTSVVAGRGPGSFAGLRVGLVAARTIGWALQLPTVGMCTLDAIAVASDPRFTGYVVTDARRRELYWARYSDGMRQGEPEVGTRDEVRALIGPDPVTGDVDLLTATDRRAAGSTSVSADALAIAAVRAVSALSSGAPSVSGSGADPLRPYYLRSPDIAKPRPPKSSLPAPPDQAGRSGRDARERRKGRGPRGQAGRTTGGNNSGGVR